MKIDAPGGWGVVSKAIMTNPDISTASKSLYALLATYAAYRTRETRVSRERLARDLGVTERAVSKYLAELVDKGVLDRQARGQGHTRQTRLHDFVVVMPEGP